MDPNQEPSLILSQGVIKLEDPDPMIMDPNQSHNFFKTSPARDALSELLEMPVTNEDSVSKYGFSYLLFRAASAPAFVFVLLHRAAQCVGAPRLAFVLIFVAC